MWKPKLKSKKGHQNIYRGKSIVDFIVRRSKLIEKIFMVIFLVSALCVPFVQVNYDLSKYLPGDMPSKIGIDLMEKEFGYPGTARVMLSPVSIYEAKTYKDRIENIPGVDMVVWADSKTDVNQSNLFIPYEEIEDYYQDGYAVMDVTFTGNNSADSTRSALAQMQAMLGDKGSFSGPAVQEKFLNEVITKEMLYIMIFGIVVILGILTLATNSWFEPVLFLAVILISIVINMGSNIIFGSISSMTLSVAAVLQLAIAMDYTIILLDNFTKQRKYQLPVEEALANAIRASITPVASAGAAAMVGFLALVLMRYSIGKDIGLVLAKGIAISLVTVMLLTPAFILRWYKIVEKTEHKPLVPAFDRVAQKIYRFRWVILTLLLLIAVPAYVGKDMTSFTYGNEAMGLSKGTVVYNDEQKINSVFGRNNLVLAIVPNVSMVSEKQLSDELENLTYVKYVTSLANTLPDGVIESAIPESDRSKLHTDNYARLLIPVKTASESDLSFSSVDEISKIVKKYYPDNSYIIGVTPSTMDIKTVIVDDWKRIDKLSLMGVALAIMLAFRSLALPVVLMIPIQMAVFVNMLVPYLEGEQIMFMGYVIVSCLQLGATIDYSIVMTYHYLEQRKRTNKVAASIKATADSMLPILTSGLILAVAGYGVGFLSSVTAIADLGVMVGRGALLSMFMVIALLPNLFIWSDRLIIKGINRASLTRKLLKRKGSKVTEVELKEEPENENVAQNFN
ncbi:MAG: MMPL family transporter [Syntrophomonadaceae bacterium]|nr:MMPL family transporter [Syntrophomonadaceae bacterium]